MERILVCSDIHRNLTNFQSALEEADRPDRILLLGDLERDPEEFRCLAGMIPCVIVRGNCDRVFGDALPENAVFTLPGHTFFLTHGHRYGVRGGSYAALFAEAQKRGADIALFGHIPRRVEERAGGALLLTPGALKDGPSGRSFLLLTLRDDGGVETEFRRL